MVNNQSEVKVQAITLEDGRRSERHISYDANGNEVVEIFAEEHRPLKLEKRIVREYKQVVAKETHQTVKDGDVVFEEVRSGDPELPLQLRERIGVAEHTKIVDGDYVRKDEIHQLIADGVVAGVSALLENMEPVTTQDPKPTAKQLVENNVAEKKNWNVATLVVIGAVVVAQLGLLGYVFLM